MNCTIEPPTEFRITILFERYELLAWFDSERNDDSVLLKRHHILYMNIFNLYYRLRHFLKYQVSQRLVIAIVPNNGFDLH